MCLKEEQGEGTASCLSGSTGLWRGPSGCDMQQTNTKLPKTKIQIATHLPVLLCMPDHLKVPRRAEHLQDRSGMLTPTSQREENNAALTFRCIHPQFEQV